MNIINKKIDLSNFENKTTSEILNNKTKDQELVLIIEEVFKALVQVDKKYAKSFKDVFNKVIKKRHKNKSLNSNLNFYNCSGLDCKYINKTDNTTTFNLSYNLLGRSYITKNLNIDTQQLKQIFNSNIQSNYLVKCGSSFQLKNGLNELIVDELQSQIEVSKTMGLTKRQVELFNALNNFSNNSSEQGTYVDLKNIYADNIEELKNDFNSYCKALTENKDYIINKTTKSVCLNIQKEAEAYSNYIKKGAYHITSVKPYKASKTTNNYFLIKDEQNNIRITHIKTNKKHIKGKMPQYKDDLINDALQQSIQNTKASIKLNENKQKIKTKTKQVKSNNLSSIFKLAQQRNEVAVNEVNNLVNKEIQDKVNTMEKVAKQKSKLFTGYKNYILEQSKKENNKKTNNQNKNIDKSF